MKKLGSAALDRESVFGEMGRILSLRLVVGASVDHAEVVVGDIGSGTVIDDPAVREPDDAVGVLEREVDLMKAGDKSDAALLADAAQQLHDATCCGGIEAGHGFVGEDQVRLLCECAGDAHALLHAAAEVVDPCEGLVQQSDSVERLEGDALVAAAEGQEAAPEGVVPDPAEQHIPQCCVARDELMMLEHHSGAPAMLSQVAA